MMAAGLCQLKDSGGRLLLDLHDRTNIATTSLDKGYPDVRAAVFPRPDQDGTDDLTAHHGASTVAWKAQWRGQFEDYNAFKEALAGICHPGNRFYVHSFIPGERVEKRIGVRADQFSAPLPNGKQIQSSWVAPEGEWESAVVSSASIGVEGSDSRVWLISDSDVISDTDLISDGPGFGLALPVMFPVTFGSGGGVLDGTGILTNRGTADAPPLIRIWGPRTAPKVLCATTDVLMSWPSLNIADGTYLEVDVGNKTARMGGDPAADEGFDFTVSDWAFIPPGDSQWQVSSHTTGAGAHTDFTWRDRYLL